MPELPEGSRAVKRDWQRRFEIDWQRFPSVVFESDDWGACEAARNAEDAAVLEQVWAGLYGTHRPVESTLESTDDLERLYSVLGDFRGADGQPAVFTAFVCVGNPDYAAIRANGFSAYADIGIDEGVPEGWARGDLPLKWREGIARGVFAPEFHSNLHHTSPVLWMDRLRGSGPEAEAARTAFECRAYCQGAHLPEFEGMNVREQHAWTETGIARFLRAAGFAPAASITSDAYPVTEAVWALHGIRTICLKNCRANSGQVVVYGNKTWNNQDPTAPVGAYDEMLDVVYLTRNAFFECTGDRGQTADVVLPVIRKRWEENEPAIVSTHRFHYASVTPGKPEAGRQQLTELLGALANVERIRYLTTAEVGDLYRNGWSLRPVGRGSVLRNWVADSAPIRLERVGTHAVSLPDGKEYAGHKDDCAVVFELPVGDYRIEPE